MSIYVDEKVWNSSFVGPVSVERRKILSHEYIHLWQADHRCSGYGVSPIWFYEGMAEYGGFATVIEAGLISAAAVRSYHLGGLQQAPATATLPSMEGAGSPNLCCSYSIFYLAIEKLVAAGSVGSLRMFCDAVGSGQSWRDAFKSTFKLSVDDFYSQFEAWRKSPT